MTRVPVRDLAPGVFGRLTMVYVVPIVPAGLSVVLLLLLLTESFESVPQGVWRIVLLTLGGAVFLGVYGWLHVSMRRHYAEGRAE
jgi:hypothetical protein